MADWATISALATAGGTLALAGVTLASVRSANRVARVAERSLLAGLRPVLMQSRPDDPQQKVHFADGKLLVVGGAGAACEASPEAVYLAMALRNVGSGIAVLHGWHFYPERRSSDQEPVPLEDFQLLSRDLYVAPGDIGFWQGAFRDPAADRFSGAAAAIAARETVCVDVLYGDHEGGQRAITRFALWPRQDGAYTAAVVRHWNVDRPDPR